TGQTEQAGPATKTATAEPAATTRSGRAAAERPAAVPRSAITRQAWKPERSATGKKRPSPGEERAAEKTAAAWRDSFSLSRHRQATRTATFALAWRTAK